MYKVDTEIAVKYVMRQAKYVFAESGEAANKEAQAALKQLSDYEMRQTIFSSNQGKIMSQKVSKLTPMLIAPEKGVKRPPLTRTQKEVLKAMLDSADHALRYDPKMNSWSISSTGGGVRHGRSVAIKTVVSLRRKNLIVPMEMTPEERAAQVAIGTMKDGEFTFVLNMKEVKKRKVYQDAN